MILPFFYFANKDNFKGNVKIYTYICVYTHIPHAHTHTHACLRGSAKLWFKQN